MSDKPSRAQDESHALAAGEPLTPAAPFAATDAIDVFAADSGEEREPQKLSLSPARILRFKWTILVVFAAVCASALAGVWIFVEPQYRSIAQIEVRPQRDMIAFKTDNDGITHFYQQFLTTQIHKITSARVIERVLERDDVRQTSLFDEVEQNVLTKLLRSPSPGKRLMDGLDVNVAHNSSILEIAVTLPDSYDSAVVANAIADEYLRAVREDEQEDSESLAAERRRQEELLRKQIEIKEEEVDALRKMLRVHTADDLVNTQRLYLDKLESRREDLLLAISNREARLKRLELLAASGDGAASAPAPDRRFSEDSVWRTLSAELKKAEFEVESARDQFGESHPTMVRLRRQVDFYKQQLAERERELELAPPATVGVKRDDEFAGMSPRELRWELEDLRAELTNLEAHIARKQKEFTSTFESAGALSKALRELQTMREQYEQIRRTRQQQEIERFAPASIRKIADARPSGAADVDKRPKLSLAAVFGAAFAGLLAGLARAYFTGALFEVEGLHDRTVSQAGPLLGPLPLVRDPRSATAEEFTVQSECVRMVRTALLQRLPHDRCNVIQITSASPGAGKTTFAIMLAKSLAHIGKRVLLVDADLRNPSIAGRLGVSGAGQEFLASLLDAQAGQTPRRDRATNVPGLRVLVSSRPARLEESEILAGVAPQRCLDAWRERYDMVLLDCSPILPVADARILARLADGTIMVVRDGHSDRRDVLDAIQTLRSAGGTILGSVFNGVPSRGGYYYHGSYGYGSAARNVYGPATDNDPLDVRVI
ncbi:MAG: hypothetical protein D6744_05880 [Planctomycetota bacterium]|nr:MAG: hypothetical protein D6744_05880 [Planctomycetota bacterium]